MPGAKRSQGTGPACERDPRGSRTGHRGGEWPTDSGRHFLYSYLKFFTAFCHLKTKNRVSVNGDNVGAGG